MVEGNLFTGNRGFGLALFVPNSLLIDIISKHNCFMGNSTSFAAIHGFGIIDGGSNVTLTAHKNNFAGFASDLVDTIPTNATYDVTNNWWGPATVVCVTNPPDCAPFQTCIDGLCEGPNNVMVTNTTSVDASNPLTKSIKCASKCSHTCAHSPFGSNFQASSPEQQQPNYVAAAELQLAVEAQA